MAQSELVSIVVVAYNNWPDLELAIQSALCQSYQPVEVIVVDNSSTDETSVEVPTRFGGQVQYVAQPNTGDAGGYNTGYRYANGDFIQFLDGDDCLAPYKIEKQMGVFLDDPEVDIVYGELRLFQGLAEQPLVRDFAEPDCDRMLEEILDPVGQVVPKEMSVLFRRRVLERVGAWDGSVYHTNFDYFLRAAWLGCSFRRCPGLHGFARVHPGQMSADVVAMERGNEAVLSKALTYIDREPYITMARANLARRQYFSAVRRVDMSRRDALAKLRRARRMKRDEISLLAYCVGLAAVLLPGGSYAAVSPRFRSLRRSVARLIGYDIPPF